MTFDEVRPVVERLLYAYGLFRRQATASQGTPNALRHEDAGRLEAVLGQLAHFERQLVAWRYFERLRWDELARRTKMPSTVLYPRLERALYAIAAMLWMLRDEAEPTAEARWG